MWVKLGENWHARKGEKRPAGDCPPVLLHHSVLSHTAWVEATATHAPRQHPGAKRIVIVGDGGLTSQNFVDLITAQAAASRPDLPIEILKGLKVDELVTRIARLPAEAHGGKIAWETSEADGTWDAVHLPLVR